MTWRTYSVNGKVYADKVIGPGKPVAVLKPYGDKHQWEVYHNGAERVGQVDTFALAKASAELELARMGRTP
jgi:hypothetical protein